MLCLRFATACLRFELAPRRNNSRGVPEQADARSAGGYAAAYLKPSKPVLDPVVRLRRVDGGKTAYHGLALSYRRLPARSVNEGSQAHNRIARFACYHVDNVS